MSIILNEIHDNIIIVAVFKLVLHYIFVGEAVIEGYVMCVCLIYHVEGNLHFQWKVIQWICKNNPN